ncbi:glucose-6-phosphate dehydrogenase [Kozakia baliensis]|uniref:glucose-6-phosphate dehydrogenase n=1 Tax=Kozakia baliensis TaxID=153496 RepID=UPI00087BD7D9|nr:glucose-6-phosphate dehydrogenase [Kozakia baliensis]AOX21022.1 glucose-6-phosphate dehydrogenase [Kozakia baliensis]
MQQMATQQRDVLSSKEPPSACTLVIFGANGDLTKRLLIPSLYDLAVADALSNDFSILAIDRVQATGESWARGLRETIESFAKDPTAEFSAAELNDTAWNSVVKTADYISGDFTQPELFQNLHGRLGTKNVIFYFAVPAGLFAVIAKNLGDAGLLKEGEGFYRRLIVEKPFGHDLATARQLDVDLLKQADESQIYRIDHFLGKEVVQSIMAMRFANSLFEPIWRREYIDHIEITAAETIGVEKRGKFYEPTGALRDMVPNHLFTLLCMVAMEPPINLSAKAVRDEKTKLLQAIRPLKPADYVRAQYGAGQINGQDVPAYRNEPDVSPESRTETYSAMRLYIDNWRWGGVPFYLRTGKRMKGRSTEVAIFLKRAPYNLFDRSEDMSGLANIIRLRLDPLHDIEMSFDVKKPGTGEILTLVQSVFSYDEFFGKETNVGYEALLYDCMKGDQMLFQSAEAIEAAWAAVEAINRPAETDLPVYAAGSEGPKEADALLAENGHKWLPVTAETIFSKTP